MVPVPGDGRPPIAKPLRPDLTGARARPLLASHQRAQRGGQNMTTLIAKLRMIGGALLIVTLATFSYPVIAQQATSVNPTAQSVKEDQLLNELDTIRGRGSIPDIRSYTIEQPAGRDWRHFHEVTLRWIGAVAIVGILALLIIFYLWRGMVRIQGRRPGVKLVRFNVFQRSVHWMAAARFVILAISRLTITFEKPLLLPLVG